MKVVCISTGNNVYITINKVYTSLKMVDINNIPFIYIINDIGDNCEYDFKFFISLEEVRNNKLKELGICL